MHAPQKQIFLCHTCAAPVETDFSPHRCMSCKDRPIVLADWFLAELDKVGGNINALGEVRKPHDEQWDYETSPHSDYTNGEYDR